MLYLKQKLILSDISLLLGCFKQAPILLCYLRVLVLIAITSSSGSSVTVIVSDLIVEVLGLVTIYS